MLENRESQAARSELMYRKWPKQAVTHQGRDPLGQSPRYAGQWLSILRSAHPAKRAIRLPNTFSSIKHQALFEFSDFKYKKPCLRKPVDNYPCKVRLHRRQHGAMVQATAGSNCLLSEARKISQQFHLSPQDIDRITKRLCEKLGMYSTSVFILEPLSLLWAALVWCSSYGCPVAYLKDD